MGKSLKIDVICNDGSPLGVVYPDIYGENGRIGLGGAELALMTLCEGWARTHEVRLYNNPTHTKLSPFQQWHIDTFIPQEDRDILIIFRSPNKRIQNAKGKKIWWSCDQYTVGDFRDFSNRVDKIITISEFHAKFLESTYGIRDTVTIDLPVRIQDYGEKVEKIKNRMIFCSVPDRGLKILAKVYPKIKEQIPDASLVITSDYRLWGVSEARNEGFITSFFGMDGVRFMGAIPRREMVKEQMLAQVQAYPCTYQELFCYSVAECSVAGAYPITTRMGALDTTNMGTQIEGDYNSIHWQNKFVDEVVNTLASSTLENMQNSVKQMAMERFSIEKILVEWEKVFNE